MSIHTYMHISMHMSIHTYMHMSMQMSRCMCIRTSIRVSIHRYLDVDMNVRGESKEPIENVFFGDNNRAIEVPS